MRTLPEGDYSLTVVDANYGGPGNEWSMTISCHVHGVEDYFVQDTIMFATKENAFRKSLGLMRVDFQLPEINPKDLIGKKFEAHLAHNKICYYLYEDPEKSAYPVENWIVAWQSRPTTPGTPSVDA